MLDDVPVRDVRVGAVDRVVRRADETARAVRERPVKRRVDGLGVVAVRRVGRRDGVVRDEHRMSGRGVDRRGVAAAVPLAAATVPVDRRVEAHVEAVARILRREGDVHQHRVAARVGDVVGRDPILAALGRGRHPAGHASGVGQRLGRVGHVARLEVSKGRPVAHLVLQRLDVGVVDRRVIRVAQDAVRDRVPDLRGRVARGAEAVLAREIEVRKVAVSDRRRDREHVRRRVVAERQRRVVERNGERDVRAVQRPTSAVVHVPAFVDRDLCLVRAGGQRRRLERGCPVAVGILEAAHRHRDRRADVVRDPVALVVVVELHRPTRRGQRDVLAP